MTTHALFDTLKFVQILKDAGIPESQAAALTRAQNEVFMEVSEHTLATKNDLLILQIAVKQDMAAFQRAVEKDMSSLRQELKEDIFQLKSHLKVYDWMIGFILTGIAALILKTFFG